MDFMFSRLLQNYIMTTNRWLGATGIGLVVLHLTLSWQVMNQTDQVILNIIYWLAIIVVIRKRTVVNHFKSGWLASSLGSLLITLILYKSSFLLAGDSPFVRIFPGLAALGLALLASGFKLFPYWREGILVTAIMVPPAGSNYVLEHLFGYKLQITIAKMSAFLMHYIGFTVQRQEITIGLPHGAVSVAYECTGGDILILLWQLCIPAIFLLPISRLHKVIMPIWTFALVLLLGSLRVAIMAIFVDNSALFEYWHGPAVNQIFSTFGIFIFGSICFWLTESHTAAGDATA